MPVLSPDDAEIDALWREVFGQPLPMLGAPEIARKILEDHLAKTERLTRPPRRSFRRP